MTFRGLLFFFVAAPLAVAASCGGESFSNANGNGSDASLQDASTEGGAICTPKSCPDLHWVCGKGDDGCNGTLDCGQCHTANFGCTDHACLCQPKTCKDLDFDCGQAPDGCGQTLHCGVCPTGQSCGGGGDHKCGSGVCVAKTCASIGADCGSVSDGCGGTLNCGTCAPPKTCGGSGSQNKCGCTPKTCAQLGWHCGTGDDGCGNPIDCGVCGGGGTCNNHQCSACVPTVTCASKHYTCGAITNDCNTQEACGAKPQVVPNTMQCSDPAHKVLWTCCASIANAIANTNGPDPDPPQPPIEAGTTCDHGATPPEPGWDCVVAQSDGAGATAWCCAQ